MNYSLALIALVAVVSTSPGSALFGSRGEPDNWVFKPLPDESDWTPEKLMQDLSMGYQPRWGDYYRDELPATVYSQLSRTQDKSSPKTIVNKYSVQDLLDLNLIYYKEATLQEYDRRKRMCEDFAPGEVSDEKWRSESRFAQSDEAKLQNQKYFLSQYCWKTFSVFRFGALKNLDEQVKRKLAKKDDENISDFYKSLMNYLDVRRNSGLTSDEVVEEYVKSYDKEKLAKVKASCEKLDKLAEAYRLEEFNTTKFGSMFRYCKGVKNV